MQSIMLGLTSVPGVMGGMLSDDRGNVLAHSFPPYFDKGTIKGAAKLLQDNTTGLQDVTGGVKLFDIRFELGRLIIKTLPNMFVAVLCQPTANVQLLSISLNVAIKKLEKMSAEQLLPQPDQQATTHIPAAKTVVAPPRPISSASGRYRAVPDGKGALLTCEIMKEAEVFFGVDSATINKSTALALSDYFETDQIKKLTITNISNGIKKNVPVSALPHDRDAVYDGKISLSKSLLESLRTKEGDQLRVEIVTSRGFFG